MGSVNLKFLGRIKTQWHRRLPRGDPRFEKLGQELTGE
jgi:hypothetical protein